MEDERINSRICKEDKRLNKENWECRVHEMWIDLSKPKTGNYSLFAALTEMCTKKIDYLRHLVHIEKWSHV